MFLSACHNKVKAQDLARKIQEIENEKRDPGNDYECCRCFFFCIQCTVLMLLNDVKLSCPLS